MADDKWGMKLTVLSRGPLSDYNERGIRRRTQDI